MTRFKVEEVFKVSGVPTHTFVEPAEFNSLRVALRNPGRGVVVEGPSGIGKSTAVVRGLESVGMGADATILSARRREDLEYIEDLPSLGDFGVAIVEDFHVLDDHIRHRIADFLKALADEEAQHRKVVIVGINRAGDSLIRHAPDLNNRIDTIRFEVEPRAKIEELVAKGEAALNVRLDAGTDVVEAAEGSFYTAQMLCYELCIEANILESVDERHSITIPYGRVRRKVMERQERRFGATARTLVRGPRFRPGGRAPYLHIVRWLTEAPGWDISLRDELPRHPNERGSVGQVVEKGWLVKHLEDEEISKLVHYDESTTVFSVEDPQLAYYLRNQNWTEFSRGAGFVRADRSDPFDFAMSFAGEDREFARLLNEELEDCGFSVFYDENEKHRIVAANVEEYLAPIYDSEASYVIVVLGPRYGEKRWPRFESEQFRERMGLGRVIPVLSSLVELSAFDGVADIGYLTFDPAADLRPQARIVAELCERKITEESAAMCSPHASAA